jgi:hypothetical protein
MTITHIVMFQPKADVKPEEVEAVRIMNTNPLLAVHLSDRATSQACKRFAALKDNCIHPTSKAPYILSVKGGKDNSPEGHQV